MSMAFAFTITRYEYIPQGIAAYTSDTGLSEATSYLYLNLKIN